MLNAALEVALQCRQMGGVEELPVSGSGSVPSPNSPCPTLHRCKVLVSV